MAQDNNHNKSELQSELQEVMHASIIAVLHDYKTLFASSRQANAMSDEANFSEYMDEKDIVARHKIGKAVLSHLETLLKIYDSFYNGNDTDALDENYKDNLIAEARASLQSKKNRSKN